MKKTTVLFDLDGTLIGMNQNEFIRLYFIAILDKLALMGYDKKSMYIALEEAIRATKNNDGTLTNEARFWKTFDEATGGASKELRNLICSFYQNEFVRVLEATCFPYPYASDILKFVKNKGLRVVLATNPLFPAVATHARIKLGGMSPDDFEYITAYENSSFCKPNPSYFAELLDKIGVKPEECIMVGNDTRDDFSAHALGIPVFILTKGLINDTGVDLSTYPYGSINEFMEYIEAL